MAAKSLQGSDALMARLKEIAENMGGGAVSVGFMANATYPDGTPVAAVAFWNEFGGMHRPPRPFFRGMIARESPTWAGKMGKLAKVTNYDGPRVLGLMGEDIKGALKQSINDFTTPGLAGSTIAAKGFAKPLIDTSMMINSVDYEVKE